MACNNIGRCIYWLNRENVLYISINETFNYRLLVRCAGKRCNFSMLTWVHTKGMEHYLLEAGVGEWGHGHFFRYLLAWLDNLFFILICFLSDLFLTIPLHILLTFFLKRLPPSFFYWNVAHVYPPPSSQNPSLKGHLKTHLLLPFLIKFKI